MVEMDPKDVQTFLVRVNCENFDHLKGLVVSYTPFEGGPIMIYNIILYADVCFHKNNLLATCMAASKTSFS